MDVDDNSRWLGSRKRSSSKSRKDRNQSSGDNPKFKTESKLTSAVNPQKSRLTANFESPAQKIALTEFLQRPPKHPFSKQLHTAQSHQTLPESENTDINKKARDDFS